MIPPINRIQPNTFPYHSTPGPIQPNKRFKPTNRQLATASSCSPLHSTLKCQVCWTPPARGTSLRGSAQARVPCLAKLGLLVSAQRPENNSLGSCHVELRKKPKQKPKPTDEHRQLAALPRGKKTDSCARPHLRGRGLRRGRGCSGGDAGSGPLRGWGQVVKEMEQGLARLIQ